MVKHILLYGLVQIGLYSLIAVGFTLLGGIVKLLNMAHGMIILSAAYLLFVFVGKINFPGVVSALMAVAFIVCFVLIMHLGFTNKLRNSVMGIILVTFGLGYAIQQIIIIVFGPYPVSIPVRIKSLNFWGVTVNGMEVVASAIGFLVVIALGMLLQRSKIGRAIRAVARNADMAAISGINISQVQLGVLAIAAVCMSLSGFLIVCIRTLTPEAGWPLLTTSFIIAVLAGMGSVWGTILAAAIIVYSELFTAFVISSVFKEAAAFVILIAVLIFRPSGLLGKRVMEE